MKNYYYKTKDERGWYCLQIKSKDTSLIEIDKNEWDEHLNYINNLPLSQDIIVNKQIRQLKSQLAATDYQAIKYAEGWISEADYAPIKTQRQSLRDQINQLEAQLANL